MTSGTPRPRSATPAPTSSNEADFEVARRVLRLEAAGIDSLATALDASFIRVLDVISEIKGRVIVTGMGKSGHVARKIAATLASTGTPAFFVHPAEASHGDLGMITQDDAVMMLSNSGETTELSDIVDYCHRHVIPLIAITQQAESALVESATAMLVLPASDEACPLGLTPTTSTTAVLALGDAIAIALLERSGFSAHEFTVLHPGGRLNQLGRKLLKVDDIMHKDDEIPLIAPDASMADTILMMTTKRFGCVGIVEPDGRLIGIITDGDLRRHMEPGLLSRSTAEVMTRNPKTISRQILAAEAVHEMNSRAITNLFVLEAGRPVGILHIHDCLRAGVV